MMGAEDHVLEDNLSEEDMVIVSLWYEYIHISYDWLIQTLQRSRQSLSLIGEYKSA
jgi:hypothetical protein